MIEYFVAVNIVSIIFNNLLIFCLVIIFLAYSIGMH